MIWNKEMETMSREERDLYILSHLKDLANVSPADYKTVLMSAIRISVMDPSSPFHDAPDIDAMLAQYESLDPDSFVTMTASILPGLGSFSETGENSAQAAAMGPSHQKVSRQVLSCTGYLPAIVPTGIISFSLPLCAAPPSASIMTVPVPLGSKPFDS